MAAARLDSSRKLMPCVPNGAVNEPLKVPSAATVVLASVVPPCVTDSDAPGMPVPLNDVGVLTVVPPVGVVTIRSGTAADAAVGNKPPNAKTKRTRKALLTRTQASKGDEAVRQCGPRLGCLAEASQLRTGCSLRSREPDRRA